MDINLPVIKRTSSPMSDVIDSLEDSGFEQTGQMLGGAVRYYENDFGLGLSIFEAPRSTIITPSGPLRGAVFGSRSFGIGDVMSESSKESSGDGDEDSKSDERGRRAAENYRV